MSQISSAPTTSVFEFTDEQRALRAAVGDFMDTVSPEAEVRRCITSDAGYDPVVWQRIAGELELPGLAVGAGYGGSGAGMVELAIVVEAMGRRLYTGPYLSTVLASLAIGRSVDEDAMRALLPGLATGAVIGTLAIAEADGRWDAAGVHCTAAEVDGQWRLSGRKRYVPDAGIADLIVIAATTPQGVALFVVEAGGSGVRIEPTEGFDLTRRLSDVILSASPARLLGELTDGPGHVEHVLDLVRVLAAAEQVGGAQAVLDMAVGYAKDRVQFGRAIGSFQAIKHMCADTLLDVESARSAAYFAAWAAQEGPAELAPVAPLAKAFCSDTYLAAAATCIQVHGGIAFTWEHPAHLYYRRARAGAQLWGDPRSQRELLAERIGL